MKYFNNKSLAIILLLNLAINNYMNKPVSQSCDYVPNEETALKVAEAIWFPIYGNSIENSKPYKAKLVDNSYWVVEGTLPKGVKGGVPYIEINKKDCKILKVTHGK